jgi:aspartyl protease family protein
MTMHVRWLLALLITTLAAAAAHAQTVTLNGQLGNQQALLVIDGQPHAVPLGATVQGVKLLSLSSGQAEVLVGGARRTVVLGAGPVRMGSGPTPPGGQEVVMTADGNGHFFTAGRINGAAVTFMVDTGASVVSIGQADADRLGLAYKDAPAGFANTANGRVPVRSIVLNALRVGDVELANVEAIVIPSQMQHILLGNSFLNRFQMRRDDQTMRLTLR